MILCALSVLGCGGGGGDGPPQHTTIGASAAWTGAVTSTGVVIFDPGLATVGTGDLEGIHGSGHEIRQFYAFSLGTPPPGIRVTHAELRLWQALVQGEPYDKNGNVVVDHVDFVGATGAATFDHQNLSRDIGTLSTRSGTGLRTLDVTDALLSDLTAGRDWSQFRLRFYSPIIHPILDSQSDFVMFRTPQGSLPGDLPTLVIYYE